MKNPMQPLIQDAFGQVYFKANAIVSALLRLSGISLNDLAEIKFSQGDWEQFYQLIGSSLVGYHEKIIVSDGSALLASSEAEEMGCKELGCRVGGCEVHCGVKTEEDHD